MYRDISLHSRKRQLQNQCSFIRNAHRKFLRLHKTILPFISAFSFLTHKINLSGTYYKRGNGFLFSILWQLIAQVGIPVKKSECHSGIVCLPFKNR